MHSKILTHSIFLKPKFLHTFFALSLGTYYVIAHPPLMFRLAFHFSRPHLILQNVESQNLQSPQNYMSPLKFSSHSSSSEQVLKRAFVNEANVLKKNSFLPLETIQVKPEVLITSHRTKAVLQSTPVDLFVILKAAEPLVQAVPVIDIMSVPSSVVPYDRIVAVHQAVTVPSEVMAPPQAEVHAPVQQVTVAPVAMVDPVVEGAPPLEQVVPVEPIVVVQQEMARVIVNNPAQNPIPITAVFPGRIEQISIKEGDRITRGQPIYTIMAMKMENIINADVDGIVRRILINRGEDVNMGQPLAEVEPIPATPLQLPAINIVPVVPQTETLPLQNTITPAPSVTIKEPALARLGQTIEPMNPILMQFLDLLEPNSAYSQDENEIRKALRRTLLSSQYRNHVKEDWVTSDTTEWILRRKNFFRDFCNNINEAALSFKIFRHDLQKLYYTEEADYHLNILPNEIVGRGGLTLYREEETCMGEGI